jgi:hypothetical protein
MTVIDPSLDEDCPPAPVPHGALARELPIVNRKGLHARASAKFVQTVERYDSDVTVTRCSETVGGRSIMGTADPRGGAGHHHYGHGQGTRRGSLPRRHRRPAGEPLRRGRVGV